jgi:hypothetical protein
MTLSEKTPESVNESRDFNVFVGAATGLLKGISLNPTTNLCKNLGTNLSSLDRSQHEITCMTWLDSTQQDKILVGLRNGTYRTFSVTDKKYIDTVKNKIDDHRIDTLVGIASYQNSVLTASESGIVKNIRLF